MPITQSVSLPTYAEVREFTIKEWLTEGSDFGVALLAGFQQVGAKQLPYLERRAALLSARAKFSMLRRRAALGITIKPKEV